MLTFEQPLLLLLFVPFGVLMYLAWRNMDLPFPRGQRWFILACRLALFALIICALAGAAWSQPVARQSVVFVGDISASTGTQRAFIEKWINAALKHKGPEDQVGIVTVGRNALVEQAVKTQVDFSHFESTPDTNYTDLAAGMRLAAAILPRESMRRIVLLSDGQQNLGDALQEAQLLQQEGIRLDVVPLPALHSAEARIDGLDAPTELHANERFLLHIRLFSTVAQPATLRLYQDQTLLRQVPAHLVVGTQEMSLSLLAPTPGFHTFRITLEAARDSVLANNEAAAFVNVLGPPHVLVIEGKAGEGQNIVSALQATKIHVTVGAPGDMPSTLDGLAAYGAVVLADVPAISLGTARMQILQAYVRDLGRGLVVSGGEHSYGPGGYAHTPLEQALPVSADVPQHKETPTIAVVLIVESLEDNAEINISKEAAKGVINLLTPRDQVGISGGCGGLVASMQHVTNRAAITHIIDTMTPCDPISYLPDLSSAESELLKTDAKVKHVILLGDGDTSEDSPTTGQLLKMAKEHITVSTVVTNANDYHQLSLMQQIAAWGKGRFYLADNPSAIPQILLKETQQATRNVIINEPFVPTIVGNHPILTDLGTLPALNGYVSTTPKTAAQVVLISHKDDPVLAAWQYGLGRVVAWTSDALGLWTANWLQWRDVVHWWANLATWTLPVPDSSLNVSTTEAGGSGHLTVELAPGTSSGGGNRQQVQAKIFTPDLFHETVTLQPTAPQRWEGDFSTTQVGAYVLQVTWQGASRRLVTTTGLIVPYSPEFRTVGTDMHFLTLLAHAARGATLTPGQAAAAFASNLPPVSAAIPITFWLLTLAALLLPLDIAARRLANVAFLGIGYRWLAAHLRLSYLQLAMQRAPTQHRVIDFTILGGLRTQREERRSQRARIKSPVLKTGEAKLHQPPSQAQPMSAKIDTTSSDVSVASKLLEAKRKRAKGRRDG